MTFEEFTGALKEQSERDFWAAGNRGRKAPAIRRHLIRELSGRNLVLTADGLGVTFGWKRAPFLGASFRQEQVFGVGSSCGGAILAVLVKLDATQEVKAFRFADVLRTVGDDQAVEAPVVDERAAELSRRALKAVATRRARAAAAAAAAEEEFVPF